MNARKEFLSVLFDVLQREAVPYCVLRNYKNIYADASSDIDLIVEAMNLKRVRDCLEQAASLSGHSLVHQARYVNFSFVYGNDAGTFTRIDVETEVRWRFFPVLSAEAVLGLRRRHENFYIPHPRHESVILLVAGIWRKALSERYRARLAELYNQMADEQALKRTFHSAFGYIGDTLAAAQAQMGRDGELGLRLQRARFSLALNAFRNAPNFQQLIHFLTSDLRRFVGRLFSPPGISLLFASSGVPAQDPDALFHKIEFLYPIKKSELVVRAIAAGEGRKTRLTWRMRLLRSFTVFKGGLFLRFYQVARDEDLQDVVRSHARWIYPSRAFVCAQNSAGYMWIRQVKTGLTAKYQVTSGALDQYDQLIDFMLRQVEQRELPSSRAPIDNGAASDSAVKRLAPGGFVPLRRLAWSALWLLLVGSLSFLSIGFLKVRARSIAEDTLPGLTYAGAASANLAQGFERTLLLLMTDDPQQRSGITADIEKFSNQTTRLFVLYKNSIFSQEDADLFGEVLKRRSQYLQVRQKTVSLVEANEREQAASFCAQQLLPAYNRYKDASAKLFEYNMREGENRGHNFLNLCTWTQCAVAAIAVSIFVTGFIIGLSRQSRVAATSAR